MPRDTCAETDYPVVRNVLAGDVTPRSAARVQFVKKNIKKEDRERTINSAESKTKVYTRTYGHLVPGTSRDTSYWCKYELHSVARHSTAGHGTARRCAAALSLSWECICSHRPRIPEQLTFDVNVTGWFKQKKQMYSPAIVHAVFSIQIVKFCTSSMYVSLRRPHLPVVFFFFFLSDFSLVMIFWKRWPTLDQDVSAKKKKNPPPTVRPRNGHVEHVCQKSGSISQKQRGHLDLCA